MNMAWEQQHESWYPSTIFIYECMYATYVCNYYFDYIQYNKKLHTYTYFIIYISIVIFTKWLPLNNFQDADVCLKVLLHDF